MQPSRGKRMQLANLIPKRRQQSANSENSPPNSNTATKYDFSSVRKIRKRKADDSDDDIFTQSVVRKPPKRPTPATRTVASQTSAVGSQFFVVQQVQHQSLLNLQLTADLSDNQMLKIAHMMRESLGVNRIISPNYEPHLIQLKRLLEDLYETQIYQCPVTNTSVPLVICTNTKVLISRLQSLHQRDIRMIHHGVDSGKPCFSFFRFSAKDTRGDTIVLLTPDVHFVIIYATK